jgi:hypothetical protein
MGLLRWLDRRRRPPYWHPAQMDRGPYPRVSRRLHRFSRLPEFWQDQREMLPWRYGLDPREGQSNYVEVWCEKDALSGVFERILQARDFPYPVPLNVCRGYPSQSFLREASRRFQREERAGRHIHILYCGDFDPSGENIAASTGWGEDEGDVQSRLRRLGCLHTTVRKVALTAEQFTRWFDETQPEHLPHDPNPIKLSDTRAEAFEKRFGNYGAELDAVPPEWLADILRDEVKQLIDLDAYASVLQRERQDREAIRRVLDSLHTDDEDE